MVDTAIYGSELMKSERSRVNEIKRVRFKLCERSGSCDFNARLAREARTTFELGNGDALITYELEGLLMKEATSRSRSLCLRPRFSASIRRS